VGNRKGATRAFGPKDMKGTIFEKTGQPIITPGSMGRQVFYWQDGKFGRIAQFGKSRGRAGNEQDGCTW